MIYSVLITCQRFGIDRHAYLRDVLTRSMSNQDDYHCLMPQYLKPAQ